MVEEGLTAPARPKLLDLPVVVERHFQVLVSALEVVLLDLLPPPFERLKF
jgi:hypothetical protein